MNKTIAYIYKWIHLPTNKWYIGSKTQDGWNPSMHEKYLCSSKIVKPLILENRNEWDYEILVIGDQQYIRKLETTLLQHINAKDDINSFNRSNACWNPGNRKGSKDTLETKIKKSNARKGNKNPMFGKTGELSPHWGKSHSELTKQRQSISIKKYASNRPKKHNENISKSLKGNPNVGNKGEKNPSWGRPEVADRINSKPPKQCPHCDKIVSIGNYARWHGDNCKFNN